MEGQPITTRLDSNETIFFKRQQESIDKKLYEAAYPDNKGYQLVPPVEGVAETAPTYTWNMVHRYGDAKVGDLGDDVPMVDVLGAPASQNIVDVTDGYRYNVNEVKEGARLGVPLDPLKAKAARDIIETKIDKLLAVGNTAQGIRGLLNQANVSLYVLGTKAAGGVSWAGATPNEIVKDVFGMASAIVDGLEDADGPEFTNLTLVLPTLAYTKIAQEKMGDGDSSTILSFILKNSPWVKEIVSWRRCKTAGAGSTTRMAMYPKDPRVVGRLTPMPFTTHAPQARGYNIIVPCQARCGGVITRYTMPIRYADGG